MRFFHGKTSKQISTPFACSSRVKKLLELALSCLAVARSPRLARKSICRSAEQIIEEDNMLQSLDIIELYCKRLVEHATQLEKPEWCADLPELQFARTILEDKFGSDDLAAAAKEGTGILVWKLSGGRTNMELKKKVVNEIATENNVMVESSELQEAIEHGNIGRSPC
ncbi:hypothetical protein BDA96_01G089500 [Sorghum bicolor]|uniref:Uncharacterized protein n=2 Tax=Sorghum bicolor TaxID=4558 RepID=A0A1Z5S4X5_SORBI|nr:hypothetical protein BDA96_01G089500 [Sorghum bicolor]OQU90964.1 hypothetical protein SORBI_3001G085450 [Sorghum bicolor]